MSDFARSDDRVTTVTFTLPAGYQWTTVEDALREAHDVEAHLRLEFMHEFFRVEAEFKKYKESVVTAYEAAQIVLEENARLKAEVERLQNNCDYLDRELDREIEKTAMLCGQVERLHKAGDAMASSIQFNEEMAQDYNGPAIVHQSVQRWAAAKEGKPRV